MLPEIPSHGPLITLIMAENHLVLSDSVSEVDKHQEIVQVQISLEIFPCIICNSIILAKDHLSSS